MRSLKRPASDEPEEDDDDDGRLLRERNRRCRSPDAVQGGIQVEVIRRLLLVLEPFFRKVLQEELQRQLSLYVGSPSSAPINNQVLAPAASRGRLSFVGDLPDKLFTCGKIKTRDGASLKIIMKDMRSGSVVFSGALSAARVEIVVIDGDFCEEDGWTEQDFARGLVREREGRRPLLIGDLAVVLKGGVATVGSLQFTDNSSWTRSRKFRLGARMISTGGLAEQRVQEAVSRAFTVKDHRGELYKKHHPPALDDEVWRLEKIAKHGAIHRRLSDKGINQVRDFLRALVMEPDWLCSVLGTAERAWKATVQHARECRLDGKLFSFYARDAHVMLVFDSIFQLIGAKFDGSDYRALEDLDLPQRALVNHLKPLAYNNRLDLLELDLQPPAPIGIPETRTGATGRFTGNPCSLATLPAGPSSSFPTGSSGDGEAETSTGGEAWFDCDWSGCAFPPGTPWALGGAPSGQFSPTRRLPRSRWAVIQAALKCGMFIRRRVAARRKAELLGFRPLSGFPKTYEM